MFFSKDLYPFIVCLRLFVCVYIQRVYVHVLCTHVCIRTYVRVRMQRHVQYTYACARSFSVCVCMKFVCDKCMHI